MTAMTMLCNNNYVIILNEFMWQCNKNDVIILNEFVFLTSRPLIRVTTATRDHALNMQCNVWPTNLRVPPSCDQFMSSQCTTVWHWCRKIPNDLQKSAGYSQLNESLNSAFLPKICIWSNAFSYELSPKAMWTHLCAQHSWHSMWHSVKPDKCQIIKHDSASSLRVKTHRVMYLFRWRTQSSKLPY